MPDQRFETISAIQRILRGMVDTHEPAFLGHAWRIFLSIAVMMIVDDAAVGVLRGESPLPRVGRRIVHFVIFSNILTFYVRPIPVIGYSFVSLFTHEAGFLMGLFDAAGFQRALDYSDVLWNRIAMPNLLSGGPFFLWVFLFILLNAAKAFAFYILAGSLIKSAVAALMGPIFISVSMFDPLSWMFQSWLRAFIQYTFVPVVASAYIFVYGAFLANVIEWLPPQIPIYLYPTYVVSLIVMVWLFVMNLWSVPGLTASLLSGHMSDSGGSFAAMLRPSAWVAASRRK